MQLSAEGFAASCTLKQRREAIADRVTKLFFEARPQLEQLWQGARQKTAEDNRHHLDFLCEALSFERPALFIEYVAWAAALLERLNISCEALAFNLR
jgi:hypothetical protein